MSKSAQRARSMYEQGRKDVLTWHGHRWRRHRYLREYNRGFNLELRKLKKEHQRLMEQHDRELGFPPSGKETIWKRIKRFFTFR